MVTVIDATPSIPSLEALWAETEGDAGIMVGVLDGPVNVSHPCFRDSNIREVSLKGGYESAPASTHGTAVAGIIFGKEANRLKGIAPGCRGLSIPIWPRVDIAATPCSQEDLAQAIKMAVDLGADVINISAGELSSGGLANSELQEAVRYCERRGVLIVAAVGNDGCCCPHVPAALESVLAVGAMNSKGAALDFSNWSPLYKESGILAPGEAIKAPVAGGGYRAMTGTSYAAAVVSGVAALLMSVQIKMGRTPDPLMIRKLLLETADPCDVGSEDNCERILAGRINLSAALKGIKASSGEAAASPLGLEDLTPDEPRSVTEHEVLAQQPAYELGQAPSTPACSDGRNDSTHDRDSSYHVLSASSEKSEEEQMSNSTDANNQAGAGGEAKELHISTELTGTAGNEARRTGPEGVRAAGCGTSDCGCGGAGGGGGQLVYVIGKIGYDFGSRARQESFNVDIAATGGTSNAADPTALAGYLSAQPYAAADLIWTVSIDSVPMYAIAPSGPFGDRGYELLVELLKGQLPNAQGQASFQRVSIPGVIQGSVRLLNSQEVPVIRPALRGVYAWDMPTLLGRATQGGPAKSRDARTAQFQNFFDRFFYELRNAGMAPSERAVNFAGTTLFQLADTFRAKIEEELVLDRIEVSKSAVCPPGGDCWDVSMILFDPKHMLERARELFRFTVDVSQVIPVRIGQVNSWATYATRL